MIDHNSDEELIEQLRRQDRAQKRRVIIIVLVVAALLGALGAWLATGGRAHLTPMLDVDASEQELAARSNDPICLSILDDVRKAAADWSTEEPRMEEDLWTDDEEAHHEIVEIARQFSARMEELKGRVDDANLRIPESRSQMREWFDNQIHEFGLIEAMADRQIKLLNDEEVEERAGLWETPEELRDQVLLTIDDNFEEFRVWAASVGYPCGEARD